MLGVFYGTGFARLIYINPDTSVNNIKGKRNGKAIPRSGRTESVSVSSAAGYSKISRAHETLQLLIRPTFRGEEREPKKQGMRDAIGALVSRKLFESVSVNDVNRSIHKRLFLHTHTH
ncbi:unnamed protein product [Leuciscus chuanchicus]